ncbi:hypothetical protein Tco_1517585 [Tanacetum coccineum]
MHHSHKLPKTVTALKLPVLKTGDYDLWSMRMKQYLTHTDYALWEVIVNGDALVIASASIKGPIPPKTAKQKLARKNELKAKSTLLLAIPDEHLLKFHGIKDAKTLWEAIKTRFQKLISQLEIHGEVISQEDANLKLLRSQPLSWNNIALIMRNKSDLDTMGMDDLYNNMKVYKAEIKSQSSSSSNSQNVAFVILSKTKQDGSQMAGGPCYQRVKRFLKDRRISELQSKKLLALIRQAKTGPTRLALKSNLSQFIQFIKFKLRGLESLEARIVVHQKNKAVYEEDIAFLKYGVKVNNVTTAGTKAIVSVVLGHEKNVVKSSACWIWRPTGKVIDHISKDSGSYMPKRFDYVDPQGTPRSVIHNMLYRIKGFLIVDALGLDITVCFFVLCGKVPSFTKETLHLSCCEEDPFRILNRWQSQAPRNHGGAPAQTRSERVLKQPNEPPLPEGHTSGSGEGRMEHTFELMDIVPPTPHGLSTSDPEVLDLEKEKDAQAVEILKLKKRVKKLERQRKSSISHPRRRIYRQVESSDDDLDEEDASKQGRTSDKTKPMFKDSDFDDLDDLVDEGMAFVQEKDAENQGKIGADDTEVVKGSGDTEAVNTAGEGVSTAAPRTPPTTTVFDDEDVTMAMAQTLIKMKEEKAKEKGVAIKDIERDAEVALRLQAELDKELRVERERQEKASKVAIAEMFDEGLYERQQKRIQDFTPMDSEKEAQKPSKRLKRVTGSYATQKSPKKPKVMKFAKDVTEKKSRNWEYLLRGKDGKQKTIMFTITKLMEVQANHGDTHAILRRLDSTLKSIQLVQERFQDHHLEGQDLMHWGQSRDDTLPNEKMNYDESTGLEIAKMEIV